MQTRRPAPSGPSKRPLQDFKGGVPISERRRSSRWRDLRGATDAAWASFVHLWCRFPQRSVVLAGSLPPARPSGPLQGFKGATEAGGPELGGLAGSERCHRCRVVMVRPSTATPLLKRVVQPLRTLRVGPSGRCKALEPACGGCSGGGRGAPLNGMGGGQGVGGVSPGSWVHGSR